MKAYASLLFPLPAGIGVPLAEGIRAVLAESAAPAEPCGDGREAPKEAAVLKTLTERKNYAQICEEQIVLIR
jgi:hypothetical protein